MTPIIVVGDLMVDVVAISGGPITVGSDTPAQISVFGGGSAANTASWLAHFGQPVTFVGRVGADAAGVSAVGALAGVDTRITVDRQRLTGFCVIIVTPDGQRSMFPDTGANAGLSAEDLPLDLFVVGSHLHLSAYPLFAPGSRAGALAALAAAQAAGMTISVDPASVGPLTFVGVPTFLSWTQGASLLLANADEARLLAGCSDLAAAGVKLLQYYSAVVVKSGADGAHWFGAGGQIEVPAVPGAVVDTTGAGDCFAAGFLPEWLAGASPTAALTAGCAAAAKVVGQSGARPIP